MVVGGMEKEPPTTTPNGCPLHPTTTPQHHSIFQETVFRPAVPPSSSYMLKVRYLPLHLYPYLPLPPTLASLPSASSAMGALFGFLPFTHAPCQCHAHPSIPFPPLTHTCPLSMALDGGRPGGGAGRGGGVAPEECRGRRGGRERGQAVRRGVPDRGAEETKRERECVCVREMEKKTGDGHGRVRACLFP